MSVFSAIITLSLLAAPQRGAENAGGDDGKLKGKAPKAALGLADKEMKKLESYGGKLSGSANDQQVAYACQVVVKGAQAKMEGGTEIYAKEHKYAAKTSGGDYAAPGDIGGQEGAQAAAAVNPQMILLEALGCDVGKEWSTDDVVGEAECKVLTADAPEKLKKAQIETFLAKVKEAAQYGLDKRADLKASVSTYRVWIGKEDLKIHKIEWSLQPKFDLKGLPMAEQYASALENIKADYTYEFDFGAAVEFAIPKEAEKVMK